MQSMIDDIIRITNKRFFSQNRVGSDLDFQGCDQRHHVIHVPVPWHGHRVSFDSAKRLRLENRV
jgi:hypothetical protein